MAAEESNPKRELSLKLTVVTRLMRRRFDASIAAHGVTRSQWSLIVVAARVPGPSQRQIAESLEITEAAAGRLIERLCSDGLLERRQDSEDKRAWRIYLTPAARPLLAILAEAGLANEAQSFAGLSEAELDQLKSLLDKVYANLVEPRPA